MTGLVTLELTNISLSYARGTLGITAIPYYSLNKVALADLVLILYYTSTIIATLSGNKVNTLP